MHPWAERSSPIFPTSRLDEYLEYINFQPVIVFDQSLEKKAQMNLLSFSPLIDLWTY